MEKWKSNTIHTISRAHDRYGVELTPDDLRCIIQQIIAGINCKKCKKISLRRNVWLVCYKERKLKLVLENNKKAQRLSIVTILPLTMEDRDIKIEQKIVPAVPKNIEEQGEKINIDRAQFNSIHAIKRAQECYGIELTPDDLQCIIQQILNGVNRKKLKQNSLRQSVWLVYYKEKKLKLIFEDNKKAKRLSIVTMLPLTNEDRNVKIEQNRVPE
jgi:hypothetical protein